MRYLLISAFVMALAGCSGGLGTPTESTTTKDEHKEGDADSENGPVTGIVVNCVGDTTVNVNVNCPHDSGNTDKEKEEK